jgi:hypothetical protein
MTTDELVEIYEAHHGMARCPAHPDHSPSLSITAGDRLTLLHCFAGCPTTTVLAARGLRLADLFEAPPSAPRDPVNVGPHLEALLRVLQAERRRRERLREAFEAYADADLVRICRARAWAWHREATALGSEHPQVWELVALAVEADRVSVLLEAYYDQP